jgi:hypothetical protein
MYTYKLKYTDKKTAIADLIRKEVYKEVKDELFYGDGIQAVVELGLIILENGIIDEDFNLIKKPVYADGYHYDVMSENKIDFGINEIQVKTPKHIFAS